MYTYIIDDEKYTFLALKSVGREIPIKTRGPINIFSS